ncbi:uncharacterized protein C8Q71DRAFT_443133 [Rhodofomes roseus]|uniref:Uncharacterized protein n=1 Tax=Rhodofomes roseus TaxID=34475 RepID=A0ABQ8JY90_9APHY|nr:uncharacterized protein C8Q71DRAFT_443133 [Rhodofomes roseus]KAH9829231.1 hypothetical protein C8Q71DRAFT_443133 [Rhodofomes roseus]
MSLRVSIPSGTHRNRISTSPFALVSFPSRSCFLFLPRALPSPPPLSLRRRRSLFAATVLSLPTPNSLITPFPAMQSTHVSAVPRPRADVLTDACPLSSRRKAASCTFCTVQSCCRRCVVFTCPRPAPTTSRICLSWLMNTAYMPRSECVL